MEKGSLHILKSSLLQTLPGITHGFSTRLGGESGGLYAGLNLSPSTGDNELVVVKNRHLFCKTLQFSLSHCALMHQIHNTEVVLFKEPNGGEDRPHADIAITRSLNLHLVIQLADCFPILIADPKVPIVSAVHAGWRGIAAGVIEQAIEALKMLGADVRNMHAAIGPGIGFCCFKVREDALSALQLDEDSFFVRSVSPDQWRVNLGGMIQAKLLHLGLRSARIDRLMHCTYCNADFFYSHRRDGKATGRHWAVIGLRNGSEEGASKSVL